MAKKDATKLLEEDHKTVDGLLEELERSRKREKREELFAKIKKEIQIHTTIEEELFYPAVDNALKTKEGHMMILEAREEHELVDKAISDIEEVDIESDAFIAKAHVLKEIINHHVEEEEDEMFPKVRKVMKKERLESLGEEMNERKEALEKQYEKEGKIYSR